MGSLFGGGGDSPDIQQAETLTPEQQELLQQILGGLSPLTSQALTPIGPQQFAPTSQLQQQAFQGFGGLGGLGIQGLDIAQQGLGGFDPGRSQGFLDTAGGALQQGLQGFDPDRILQALEPGRQLAQRQFQQETVPNLLERFGATSGASGALNQALAEAGANLSLGLNAQAAPFLGQAALQAPGQQLQGAGLAGNLAQLPGQLAQQSLGIGGAGSDILGQLLNVGGIQRGIAQEPFSAQFQAAQQPAQLLSQFAPLGLGTQAFTNFQQQQQPGLFQSLLPALGQFAGSEAGSQLFSSGLGSLAGGIGGLFAGGGGAAAAGAAAGAGAGGAGLVGGLTGAATLAGLFSDERVKENIEPIENALEKVEQLNGVTFDYTDAVVTDGTVHGGIIAQDLEKVLPKAVTEVDGIKKVDMNAVIGLLVEAVKELNNKIQEN